MAPWRPYIGREPVHWSSFFLVHQNKNFSVKVKLNCWQVSKKYRQKVWVRIICTVISVITLKGGQTLILRDNEILVPGKERKNMLALAHATNHRGEDGMIKQMRGRVFWEGMNKNIKALVDTCEKCQVHGRSLKKDKTEISHKSMFNLYPNHTITWITVCMVGRIT